MFPVAVDRANVCAQMRRKRPKPSSPETKSAWTATALLAYESAYHAVTTPACEPLSIEEEVQWNFKGVPEGCMPYTPPQDTGIFGTLLYYVRE